MLERRVVHGHFDLGEQRHDLMLGQKAPELPLDHVADHAFGLGAQHVERVRRHLRIGRRLQREQSHLRAVAVGDDDLVRARDRRDCRGGARDVPPLHLGLERLAAFQQRIAAQSDDDFHGLVPCSVPSSRSTAVHSPGVSSSANS